MVFAWAAKYCEKFLYGVVPRGWKPSRNLLKYISSRKKKIHWVRLDVLPADTIRNLRAMHFTSTALKNHPDYENILARFVGDGK